VSSPVPAPFAGTDACPANTPGVADTLDEALQTAGLTRCEVRLLPDDVALSGWPPEVLVDKRRLADFTPLHLGPLRLPAYGRETASWLDAAVEGIHPASDTIAALSARRGHVLAEACADLSAFEPNAVDETPLATAILLLEQHQGSMGDEATLRAAAAPIPLGLQQKLARLIGAFDHAATETKGALGTTGINQLKFLSRTYALYVPISFGFSTTPDKIASLDDVDLNRMTDAAALLAKAIEEADFAAEPDSTFPPFDVQTALGRVVIHDSSDDTYVVAGDDMVVLFDLGGNDTYEVPAGASDEAHPVAIAVDVRGVDQYGYAVVPDSLDAGLLPSDMSGRYNPSLPPDQDYGPITLSRVGRQGAGLAGIGMLFDLGAEGDKYLSLALSQGFASMGVGLLYDAGGDDEYHAEVASQGAATFGIAALVDRAGNDIHRSFAFSQGFGGAQGAAALVDRAGDDEYFCDPGNPAEGGHPLYFSPQLPGVGNSSMSQGTAMGRRPQDATDASHMAGGIGILRDAGGIDHYTASVFAQASGYWQGIGILLDGGAENDIYNGHWYVQGATAHFALSMFIDEGGDDRYNPDLGIKATSIGVGHDFSASFHIDEGGADQYSAPGLSLGSGNINGIGCFINSGGDDTYTAAGDPTLGAGNYSAEAPFGEPRQDAPTIGIFVDAGGTDTYTVAGTVRALDNTTWSYEPQPYPPPQMVLTEHGASADDANGSVTVP
jgi:hypothetical protein